jgi:hypothetical protein
MNQINLKKKSLLILALMISGLMLGAFVTEVEFIGKAIGLAIALLSVMTGFIFAARLKCQKCNYLLSRKFPVGSLILLGFAKEKCPQCHEQL